MRYCSFVNIFFAMNNMKKLVVLISVFCVPSINLISSDLRDAYSKRSRIAGCSPVYPEIDVQAKLTATLASARKNPYYQTAVSFELPLGRRCFEKLITDGRYQKIKEFRFYFKELNIEDALAQFEMAIQAIDPDKPVVERINFHCYGHYAEIVSWQRFTCLDDAFNRLRSLKNVMLQGFTLSNISAAMTDRLKIYTDCAGATSSYDFIREPVLCGSDGLSLSFGVVRFYS